MHPNVTYLRHHFGSLTDEALLKIDRADLVDLARNCYDDEVSQRGLTLVREPLELDEEVSPPPTAMGEPEPDWLDRSVEIYAAVSRPGFDAMEHIADVCGALNGWNIPNYAELVNETDEERLGEQRWRLLVPANLSWLARNVIERDLLNPEYEAGWKAFLEGLSDNELAAMPPKVALCGLYDLIHRLTRIYEEELRRRCRAATAD